MAIRVLNPKQLYRFAEDGFFILRELVSPTSIAAIRQEIERVLKAGPVLKSALFDREKQARNKELEQIPLTERYRKLGQLGPQLEPLWEHFFAHPKVVAVVQDFLGNDILLKYSSVFLKPARTGGATPWHQDIGLWRDDNVDALNAWMAIDASTIENGCLQFVPGSHKGPIVPHIQYDDGVHPELPRDLCLDLKVEQIELQPGDVVFWHSRMWHYSPPNRSARGRIGLGSVWVNPQQLPTVAPSVKKLAWVMQRGLRCFFPSTELHLAEPLAVSST